MSNIYNGLAKAITEEPYDDAEFPSMLDGVRGMNFIEKTVESHHSGNIWVDMDNSLD